MSTPSASTVLSDQQKQKALSWYVILMLFLTCALVFTVTYAQQFYRTDGSTFFSCMIIAGTLVFCLLCCWQMKLPWRFYGFIKPSMKSVIETSIVSIVFCILVLILKIICIHYVPLVASDATWMFLQANTTSAKNIILLSLVLYICFVPFQCFIFHGVAQGMMMVLFDVPWKGFFCVIMSTVFFCAVHDLLGLSYALLVCLPGLAWCVLYYRHQSIVPIIISHIIIGGFLLCILGVSTFLYIINALI